MMAKLALERARHRCERCGADGVPLQVHHVRPLARGGSELPPIDKLLASAPIATENELDRWRPDACDAPRALSNGDDPDGERARRSVGAPIRGRAADGRAAEPKQTP
jgi:hypothetical protein